MSLIDVSNELCIRCGVCVETCPISIISQGKDGLPFVAESKEQRCVLCGHCEAICSTSALKNNCLPNTNPIQKNKLQEITPENLAEYFRSRRSIRTFLPKNVDKEVLKDILEIVNYAPTGINLQMNKWVVVSDSKIIQQLGEAVIAWMKTMLQTNPDLAKLLNCEGLISSFEQGNDVICRGAHNLVIGYTDASYPAGAIDSIIATSHLELLLPSFGLGGCWAGYLMIALRSTPDIRKIIGLDDSHTIHSVLMVGYPKYRFYKIPYRKEPQINWL